MDDTRNPIRSIENGMYPHFIILFLFVIGSLFRLLPSCKSRNIITVVMHWVTCIIEAIMVSNLYVFMAYHTFQSCFRFKPLYPPLNHNFPLLFLSSDTNHR